MSSKISQNRSGVAALVLLLLLKKWSTLAYTGVLMMRDLYVPGFRAAHPELCPALGHGLNLIILVISAPRNYMERQAIRRTWGLQAKMNKVPVAFIVGSCPLDVEDSILIEDERHKDIIRSNFVDSYMNLTLKTISALEWIDTYCYRVNKILKADDDTFINIRRLIFFVKRRLNVTRTIWGNQIGLSQPDRSPTSRHYVPKTQYPEDVYPLCLSGPAYLLSRDIVSALLTKALEDNQTFFNLEDVLFTGVLAEKLEISRVHVTEFNNTIMDCYNHPCVDEIISIDRLRFDDQDYCQKRLFDEDCRYDKLSSLITAVT